MMGTAGLPPTQSKKQQATVRYLSDSKITRSLCTRTIRSVWLKVVHDTTFCSNPNVIPDVKMLQYTCLSANVHVIAQCRTPGNPSLRSNDAAGSKLDIVTNLNLFAKPSSRSVRYFESRVYFKTRKTSSIHTRLSSLQCLPITVLRQLPRSIVQFALQSIQPKARQKLTNMTLKTQEHHCLDVTIN